MDYSLLGGIFLEGVLSFLSPCVLPLIPLYMSYLAGDNKQVDEQGNVKYDVLKVFITTIFFVLGIAFTFVLLSLTVNTFKSYLENYSELISIVGGTILIIFALHQLGFIHIDLLDRQAKLNINLHLEKMNFLKAFLLGFVFSLGWSPCIGPMLANAILLASTSTNGYLYLFVYALGLIIPFLITGLFTSTILNFLNKNKNTLNWVLKIAGVVLLLFGIYMIYNASKSILELKNYKNTVNINPSSSIEQNNEEDIENFLYNYEFKDTDGNLVKLSDYKGKYIFLNFTTTWCTYCKGEIPDYKQFSDQNDDVVCLYAMTPLNEQADDAIEKYVKDNDVKITTINDTDGVLFYYCGVNSYPTKYIISPEGKFLVYAHGAMTTDSLAEFLDYGKGVTR